MKKDDSVIVVPATKGTLSSCEYKHTIYINNSGYLSEIKRLVPEGLDIRGMFMDFPEGLQEVRIILGGYKIAIFTKDMKDDMENFPIYLTLSKYQVCSIELVYSSKWLEEREEFEMVDEYIDNIEYGDEVEIFDGYEYRIGNLVKKNRVLSGFKQRIVTKRVDVMFPEIRIIVGKNQHDGSKAQVSVRERIDLTGIDDDYKNRLLKKHNMVIVDNKVGYVTNIVYYTHNMAGLMYTFS